MTMAGVTNKKFNGTSTIHMPWIRWHSVVFDKIRTGLGQNLVPNKTGSCGFQNGPPYCQLSPVVSPGTYQNKKARPTLLLSKTIKATRLVRLSARKVVDSKSQWSQTISLEDGRTVCSLHKAIRSHCYNFAAALYYFKSKV